MQEDRELYKYDRVVLLDVVIAMSILSWSWSFFGLIIPKVMLAPSTN